jgi:hypothetical protein
VAKNRDKTEFQKVVEKLVDKPIPKRIRIITIVDYAYEEARYVVSDGRGKELYFSKPYSSKSAAKTAAINEHSGRTNFAYVLHYFDNRSSKLIKETL